MNTPISRNERGIAYTFYSFKGGVGRSMALANVAALLAKWGRRVLVVDWDLEAPGLEKFFSSSAPRVIEERKVHAGIVDLVVAYAEGAPLDWRDELVSVAIGSNGARVSLITAGRSGPDYSKRLQALDFERLFAEKALGSYIEKLREEWLAEFDFVLIDSRTGVTDIGGICTVQLADVLVLLFTTTEASVEGTKDIIERARRQQQLLPVDRQRLLAVPVPARDESRTEYREAAKWKSRFGIEFQELFADWLPSGVTAQDAIEVLRIPYVPYWSFGERLPVIEEGTTDPSSLGHAYELLSRLLDARLDWHKAMEGQPVAPSPVPIREHLDEEWLAHQRAAALHALKEHGQTAYMEIYHGSHSIPSGRSQSELLAIARQVAIHTFGWPIGVVLDGNDESRPRPTKDGIVASIPHSGSYDYWALRENGDFYSLMTYFEDERRPNSLFFNTRIVRVSEMLLRCGSLYRALGAVPSSIIEVRIRYSGIRGRTLSVAGNRYFSPSKNTMEDQLDVRVSFRLGSLDDELVELVKKLCAPLFELFDFKQIADQIYEEIVNQFVAGRVS
jgi:MinD-like ATPase involved in chromosome partitioning or flagellar assembly